MENWEKGQWPLLYKAKVILNIHQQFRLDYFSNFHQLRCSKVNLSQRLRCIHCTLFVLDWKRLRFRHFCRRNLVTWNKWLFCHRIWNLQSEKNSIQYFEIEKNLNMFMIKTNLGFFLWKYKNSFKHFPTKVQEIFHAFFKNTKNLFIKIFFEMKETYVGFSFENTRNLTSIFLQKYKKSFMDFSKTRKTYSSKFSFEMKEVYSAFSFKNTRNLIKIFFQKY